MRRAFSVLLVLVVFAGCAVGPIGPATDNSHTHSQGSNVSNATSGTIVTVTDVVDGDTVHVRYRNGSTETVRLLGVDTPETSGEISPAEFEGVPDTRRGEICLRDEARAATGFATDRLLDEEVRLEFDTVADRRDRYGRLLAYVYVGNESVNYRLVSEGYARVFDSQFSESTRFYDAESPAQQSHEGVWRCTRMNTSTPTDGPSGNTGSIAVVRVHADAEGNDHENLNGEYLVFENTGNETLRLGGWIIGDAGGHTYVVPDSFTFEPAEQVILYTGPGTNTEGHLYWGAETAVWNNEGDTISVYDDSGSLRFRHTYPE